MSLREELMGFGFRPLADVRGVEDSCESVCLVCSTVLQVSLADVRAGFRCEHRPPDERVYHGSRTCRRCKSRFVEGGSVFLCGECLAKPDKFCLMCEQVLPVEAFPMKSTAGKRYVSSYCRDCYKKRRGYGRQKAKVKPVIYPIDRQECAVCGVVKHATEFYRNKGMPTGISKRCAECSRAEKRKFAEDMTPEEKVEYRARRRASTDANPVSRTILRLREFNLTLEQYDAMMRAQGFRCAICREFETLVRDGMVVQLSVDHDHSCCPQKGRSCGRCVRELLCSNCNRGIGYFDDDVEKVDKAITYLKLWSL